MSNRETVEMLVTKRFQSERNNPHAWVAAILAYGEQVRREQREVDAQVADGWARSPSCLQPHEDNPCCHVRTGAGIADAIRANDQGTKPKGGVERL